MPPSSSTIWSAGRAAICGNGEAGRRAAGARRVRIIANRLTAVEGAHGRPSGSAIRWRSCPRRRTAKRGCAPRSWIRRRPWRPSPGPFCALATGETTVRVTGRGRGGRNQEFALALPRRRSAASAGARRQRRYGRGRRADRRRRRVVDGTTVRRSQQMGRAGGVAGGQRRLQFLRAARRPGERGPTGTNVGDVHVFLAERLKISQENQKAGRL